VALVVLVKDPTSAPRPSATPADTVTLPVPVAHGSPLPRDFWRVVVLLGIVAVVNFSDVLVLLRLVDLGWSTTKVVLAYVLFNGVYTLGSYPAGVLTDTWRRSTVYGVGLGAFAVGYLGLGLSHTSWVVFVCIGVYGLFPAFTDGVGKAWIASLVPHEHLGRAQGVYQGLNSGAVLVAGLWAGLLWNVGSGKGVVPLVVAGIGGVVACFAVTASGRRAGLTR
jgi:MFS family permease